MKKMPLLVLSSLVILTGCTLGQTGENNTPNQPDNPEPTVLKTKAEIDENFETLFMTQEDFVEKGIPKEFFYRSTLDQGLGLLVHEISYSEADHYFSNTVLNGENSDIVQAQFKMKLVGDKLIANEYDPGGGYYDVIENATHETFMEAVKNCPINFGRVNEIAYKYLHSNTTMTLEMEALAFENGGPFVVDEEKTHIEKYENTFTTLGKGQLIHKLDLLCSYDVDSQSTRDELAKSDRDMLIEYNNHLLTKLDYKDYEHVVYQGKPKEIQQRLVTKDLTFKAPEVEVTTQGKQQSPMLSGAINITINNFLDQFLEITNW